jgi:hypothetical protein
MSNIKKPLQIKDIPQNLLAEISNIIHSYSTNLIKISSDRHGEEIMASVGSGTFITIGDVAGILTAEHVIDLLENFSFNGPTKSLGLPILPYEHKFVIEYKLIKLHRIAKGKIDSEGPDLAFIRIPQTILGRIKSYKSFFDIQQLRTNMLSFPPKPDLGIWAICGAPDIETKNEKPTKCFSEIKGFRSYCFFGNISRIYEKGNYDYLEIKVNYDSDNEIPKSFGGISGGGVWQIPLIKMGNLEMKPQDYILSGVTFYQTKRSGKFRSIRCHAQKSIYKVVYDAIEKNVIKN